MSSTDPQGVAVPDHVTSWVRYDPDYLDRKLWWECLNAVKFTKTRRVRRDPAYMAHNLYLAEGGPLKPGYNPPMSIGLLRRREKALTEASKPDGRRNNGGARKGAGRPRTDAPRCSCGRHTLREAQQLRLRCGKAS